MKIKYIISHENEIESMAIAQSLNCKSGEWYYLLDGNSEHVKSLREHRITHINNEIGNVNREQLIGKFSETEIKFFTGESSGKN